MKNKKVMRLLSLIMASILFCTSCSGKPQEQTVSEAEQSIEKTVENNTEEEEETVKEAVKETTTSSEEAVVEEGILPVHWNILQKQKDQVLSRRSQVVNTCRGCCSTIMDTLKM